jgi:hypothetical protein
MSTDTFKAVTWNVYFGTKVDELAPIMAAQLKRGVSLFLLQEAGGPDIAKLCKDRGLETFLHPRQYRVAWDPTVWVEIATQGLRLSDQPYYAKGKPDNEQWSDAAQVILCDKVGRSLTAISYHTPAHVQVPEAARPERRYDAMLESFLTLGDLAEEAETTGWLSGGDDNWDETTGLQTEAVRRILLGSATGLRQVQSPPGTATHGRVRQIDDFRIPRGGRLRPGDGWVADGGGDHKLHGREFRWVQGVKADRS